MQRFRTFLGQPDRAAPAPRISRSPNQPFGRSVCVEGGFPWATSHTFRRTVATRLDERGARARDIADQLGHAQIRTTIDHYLARDFEGNKSHLADLLE